MNASITNRSTRTCTRCVMDTTSASIEFDAQGQCNYCTSHLATLAARVPLEARQAQLHRLVEQVKQLGQNQPYDCLIGVSGGVDSTYVAYKVRELGLRPLAIHVDNSWNSELAVANIEKTMRTLSIDLKTVVLDWDEFRDLQKAFLTASVSDAEIPTDHAIFAVILHTAVEHKIPYIISGVNVEHEGILPHDWTYGVLDWRYIHAVHRQHGTIPLRTYPHVNLFTIARYFAVHRLKSIRLLDYLDYNKNQAIEALTSKLGWKYYGGKHYESIYTRFFQSYILPRKFNIDKRKAHCSSLICAGQMTRNDALSILKQPICAPEQEAEDFVYVIKKLGMTEGQFTQMMAAPVQNYRMFPNYQGLIKAIAPPIAWTKTLGILPKRCSV